MRRALAALPLVCALPFACSYAYESSLRIELPAALVSESTPEQSYRVRVCWTDPGEVETGTLEIEAQTPGAAERVELRLPDADSVTMVSATATERGDWPMVEWSTFGADPELMCDEGTIVTFVLLELGGEPVEVEWTVHARVASSSDEQVERIDLEVIVDPV
jgi:hypothetical protein